MFLLDDILLATVIACIILIVKFLLFNSIGLLLILLGGTGIKGFKNGGATSVGGVNDEEIKAKIDDFIKNLKEIPFESLDRNINFIIIPELRDLSNGYTFIRYDDNKPTTMNEYLKIVTELYNPSTVSSSTSSVSSSTSTVSSSTSTVSSSTSTVSSSTPAVSSSTPSVSSITPAVSSSTPAVSSSTPAVSFDKQKPIDLESKLWEGYYKPSVLETKSDMQLESKGQSKIVTLRKLDKDYPITDSKATKNYNIKNIKYNTDNTENQQQIIKNIFRYAVLETMRGLTSEELKDLNTLIKSFKTGVDSMDVTFNDGSTLNGIRNCYTKSLIHLGLSYSNVYKKLHNGQRKLLLSEIDFFNRVCKSESESKSAVDFHKRPLHMVYPGAAPGTHLLYLLDLYPNLKLFLWDPAKFDPILLYCDIIRRFPCLDINDAPACTKPKDHKYHKYIKEYCEDELWKYSIHKCNNYIDLGEENEYVCRQHIYNYQFLKIKKYKGRVFINMELTDKFFEYHDNSLHKKPNPNLNFKSEHGLFLQRSANKYLEHKEEHKDGLTLLCSDIRSFDNMKAISFLAGTTLDISDSYPVKILHENALDTNYIRDMDLQKSWVEMVNPDYSLLKFKLNRKYSMPYNPQYEYLNGEIILQAWAPVTSSETRLFVKGSKVPNKLYNIEKYNDMLKTFNIMRPNPIENVDIDSINVNTIWKGLYPKDGIFGKARRESTSIGLDAVLETYILYDYFKSLPADKYVPRPLRNQPKKTDIKIQEMIKKITEITGGRLNYGSYNNDLKFCDM